MAPFPVSSFTILVKWLLQYEQERCNCQVGTSVFENGDSGLLFDCCLECGTPGGNPVPVSYRVNPSCYTQLYGPLTLGLEIEHLWVRSKPDIRLERCKNSESSPVIVGDARV